MRALHFLEPGRLEWRETAEPALIDDTDALVRPLAVATCDLDWGIVRGSVPFPGPFAFGHEAVAEVVATGPGVTGLSPGQRVVVPFQIACGACGRCRRGLTGSCERVPPLSAFGLAPLSREWGGALSDMLRVPYADAMLVPLPDGVAPAVAASVADNVPDGWRAVAPALAARPGAPVLVLGGAGSGSVGLYAAAIAVALGSERVDYADDDPQRLAVAEKVGAHPVDGPARRRYGPYPIVVNHSASPPGLVAALRSTEPGGVCTSTTVYFGDETPVPLFEMYTTGVTLVTGRVDARATIPAVLDLVASGRLRPEAVTARVVDWDDAPEALAAHTHKTVVVR